MMFTFFSVQSLWESEPRPLSRKHPLALLCGHLWGWSRCGRPALRAGMTSAKGLAPSVSSHRTQRGGTRRSPGLVKGTLKNVRDPLSPSVDLFSFLPTLSQASFSSPPPTIHYVKPYSSPLLLGVCSPLLLVLPAFPSFPSSAFSSPRFNISLRSWQGGERLRPRGRGRPHAEVQGTQSRRCLSDP